MFLDRLAFIVKINWMLLGQFLWILIGKLLCSPVSTSHFQSKDNLSIRKIPQFIKSPFAFYIMFSVCKLILLNCLHDCCVSYPLFSELYIFYIILLSISWWALGKVYIFVSLRTYSVFLFLISYSIFFCLSRAGSLVVIEATTEKQTALLLLFFSAFGHFWSCIIIITTDLLQLLCNIFEVTNFKCITELLLTDMPPTCSHWRTRSDPRQKNKKLVRLFAVSVLKSK